MKIMQAAAGMGGALTPCRVVTGMFLWWICSTALAGDLCSEAMGPSEVLECFAKSQPSKPTAQKLWETLFFDPRSVDSYCRSATIPPNPAPNTILKQYFTAFCGSNKAAYFSYEQFIHADQSLAKRLGSKYQFMRSGDTNLKLQELANFLATAAQETTGNGAFSDITKYTTDGLFFRYEAPYTLVQCFSAPDNPDFVSENQISKRDSGCNALDVSAFKTQYYPLSTYVVAQQQGSNLLSTQFVMDKDCKYTLTDPDPLISCWDASIDKSALPDLIGGVSKAPDGYQWQFMNQVLDSGYWVGMGNLQLTGVNVFKFFGWYHQNMVTPKIQNADFKAFVARYLNDGELAWMGGLWYWNFRTSGIGEPNLHAVLTGPKSACHDIGITTALVNGANQCNQDNPRQLYYNYFKSTIFGLPNTPIPVPGSLENSYGCSQSVLNYCKAP